MDAKQYESWSRTISFSLKLIGIVGIVFVVIFWAFTNRIELAFLPFFGTLAGVGEAMDILREIKYGGSGRRDDDDA